MQSEKMMKNKQNNAVSGVIWKFAERICAQGVSFLVSVVLARMLLPEDYGVISLVLVFINIANVFVTNGLGVSLIQKKDSDELDFSSIFYCSLFLGIFLYGVVFWVAPYIATFYNNPLLCPVTRVLGIKLILASVNSIQQAYVSKTLQFEKFFFATLIGTVISGIVGVTMAFSGFGVWSLVFQYLTNSFIDIICLFISVKWYPQLAFSWMRTKNLIGYAWKIMASSFVNIASGQVHNLIIGKIYSPSDLAFYEKGNFFPQIVISNVNSAVSDVTLPFMAQSSDNKERLKQFSRKSLRISSYAVTPLLVGLFLVAEEAVGVILTDKWLPSVPFLRMMCLYWITQPIQTINWQILKATGNADICLKLELWKKSISLILLVAVMNISVEAIVWISVLMAYLSVFLNALPVRRIIDYKFKEQFLDVLPGFVLSLLMACVVVPIKFLNCNPILKLIMECIAGGITFIAASAMTHNPEFKIILSKFKNIVRRGKHK